MKTILKNLVIMLIGICLCFSFFTACEQSEEDVQRTFNGYGITDDGIFYASMDLVNFGQSSLTVNASDFYIEVGGEKLYAENLITGYKSSSITINGVVTEEFVSILEPSKVVEKEKAVEIKVAFEGKTESEVESFYYKSIKLN